MTEHFGPYELIELLGRGGMGEVWRAVDTRKGRTVALKRLPAEMTGEREFEDRFRREAQAAVRLNDPHVIPIHDFGEIEGRLFLDMRLVAGDDLGAVVEKEGALEPARAVSVLEQVASALDAAHDEGLVHRDVKPSNILLTPSKGTAAPRDFVYLIDFGIATGAALGTRLTQTGLAIGTAAYMAPERFTDGVDADRRIDVYALGCVLHEMLTGRAAFAGRDFASLMYQHINTAPTAPSRITGGLPAGFDEVVARALAKDPDDRWSRAGDLTEAARRVLAPTRPAPQGRVETQVPPRPAPPVERPVPQAGAAPPIRPATAFGPPAFAQPWQPGPPRYAAATGAGGPAARPDRRAHRRGDLRIAGGRPPRPDLRGRGGVGARGVRHPRDLVRRRRERPARRAHGRPRRGPGRDGAERARTSDDATGRARLGRGRRRVRPPDRRGGVVALRSAGWVP